MAIESLQASIERSRSAATSHTSWRTRVSRRLRSGRARPGEVERHAAGIADSASKLKYLRSHMPSSSRRARRIERPAILLLVGIFGLVGWMRFAPGVSGHALRPQKNRTAPPSPKPVPPPEPAAIWQVERSGQAESYSNGLVIRTSYAARTSPRSYRAWDHSLAALSAPRSKPAGIVFHTTESQLAPFDASHNRSLVHNGADLLRYVRNNCLYHFVIDRFGRVFRVVAETDFANHAGYSIWADNESVYLNLNSSFLAVAFEARTSPDESVITEAQLHSGRLLTDLLRLRYGIPEIDCVAHAQVSVNPSNTQIGYHTDWSASFPFAAMGLGDGYRRTLPAITVFGFEYQSGFVARTAGLWEGIAASEETVLRAATGRRLATADYRRLLRRKYRNCERAVRPAAPQEGISNE